MFFTDFEPKDLDSYKLNKDIAEMVKRHTGLLNTVIYGCNGVGKFTLARMMIKKYYNLPVLNIKKDEYLDNKINSSRHHFELFVSQYNYKDKNSFVKTLEEFTNTKNVSTGDNNIIIIKNADFLSRDNILTIKKITERSDKFVTFILTMNKFSKHRGMLNSFFTIRMPSPKKEEISEFICDKVDDMGVVGLGRDQIDKIVQTNRGNLKSIFIDFEILLLGNKLYSEKKLKIKNEINKFVKKLVNSIFNLEYQEVRDNLYELSTRNIEKQEILKLIFDKIIKCEMEDKDKIKITNFASKYSQRMGKCNKEITQIEAFCFECMSVFL